MERLTERELYDGKVCYTKCASTNCPDKCSMCSIPEEAEAKLKEYEDAEEQGKVLRLPCKVGDTVYWLTTHGVLERYVSSMDLIRTNHIAIKLQPLGFDEEIYPISTIVFSEDFGETVFLTKERAEIALKKMDVEVKGDD